MDREYIVVCIKWGEVYTSDYVNALHKGVLKYSSNKIRFVCITDNTDGLNEGIETIDICQLRECLSDEYVSRGNWQKLLMYKAGLFPENSIVLFFDLDVVIVDQLDDLFACVEKQNGLHICKNWWLHKKLDQIPPHLFGNSSVVGFIANEQSHILELFLEKGKPEYVRREQQFVSEYANNIINWDIDWIAQYKTDCVSLFPMNLVFPPSPPKGTRVVIFPGSIKPKDLIGDGFYIWGTNTKFGFGKVPWVKEYWS